MNDIGIDPLFSFPVMFPKETFNLSEDKLKYILNLERESNTNNFTSKNKFVLDDDSLKELKDWILKYVNIYCKELMKFIETEFYITQSWVNYSNFKQSHHRHKHPNSLVSGVFYLDDGDSPIVFYNSSVRFPIDVNKSSFNIYNGDSYRYKTKKNQLILFPSQLIHDVEPQNKNKIRMSLSFNTWLKGKVGNIKTVDELNLS